MSNRTIRVRSKYRNQMRVLLFFEVRPPGAKVDGLAFVRKRRAFRRERRRLRRGAYVAQFSTHVLTSTVMHVKWLTMDETLVTYLDPHCNAPGESHASTETDTAQGSTGVPEHRDC